MSKIDNVLFDLLPKRGFSLTRKEAEEMVKQIPSSLKLQESIEKRIPKLKEENKHSHFRPFTTTIIELESLVRNSKK